MSSYDNYEMQGEINPEIMSWLQGIPVEPNPEVYLGNWEVLVETISQTLMTVKELMLDVNKTIHSGLRKYFKLADELKDSELFTELRDSTRNQMFLVTNKEEYFRSKLCQFDAQKQLELAPLIRGSRAAFLEMVKKDPKGVLFRIIEENRATAMLSFNLQDFKKEWERVKEDLDHHITHCIKTALNLVITHRISRVCPESKN